MHRVMTKSLSCMSAEVVRRTISFKAPRLTLQKQCNRCKKNMSVMAAMEPLVEDVFSSGNLCSDNGTFSPGPVSAVYLRAKFCWLMGAHGLGPVAWLREHGTDILSHRANGSREDSLKSDMSWSISKYLQLNNIDCDESVTCQSTENKKSSLPVIGKDIGQMTDENGVFFKSGPPERSFITFTQLQWLNKCQFCAFIQYQCSNANL